MLPGRIHDSFIQRGYCVAVGPPSMPRVCPLRQVDAEVVGPADPTEGDAALGARA